MALGSIESQMNWERERPIEDFLEIIDEIKEGLDELSKKTGKDRLEILNSIGLEIDLKTIQKEGIEEYLKSYTFEKLQDIKHLLENFEDINYEEIEAIKEIEEGFEEDENSQV